MSGRNVDVEAIRRRHQRASEMVSALCQPLDTDGAKSWMMSIPARPDHYPDLVISDSLRDVQDLLVENERLRKALGNISRMRTMPDHKSNTFTLVAAHTLAQQALNGPDMLGDEPAP